MYPHYLRNLQIAAAISLLSVPSARAQNVVEAPRQDAVTSPSKVAPLDWSYLKYMKRPDVLAAKKLFGERRDALIAEARGYFRGGDYARAAATYAAAERIQLELPDWPLDPPGPWLLEHESVEWGDALALLGRTDEAIKQYRKVVYGKLPLSMWQPNDELSPIANLPPGATDIEDARVRFRSECVSVWVANERTILSRYALLLATVKEYSEALVVYERARNCHEDSSYQAALSMGNMSPTNFDPRRFAAGARTLFSRGAVASSHSQANMTAQSLNVMFFRRTEGISPYYEYYTEAEARSIQRTELSKALGVMPGYAPALVAYAEEVAQQGKAASEEERRRARQYLVDAEVCARGKAQHELVQQRGAYIRDYLRL